MSANRSIAKFLRFLGVLLMGMTAGFTLLGGVGTSCVALKPAGFGESMARLAPYQWLYILFVLAGLALGVLGIRATILLVRGAGRAYRDAMIVLVAGLLVGGLHIFTSRSLRGSSMPVDAVVFTTFLTLSVFLLFRIPLIWRVVNYSQDRSRSAHPMGGAVAILLGFLTLTIEYTMGSTHTWNGINYAGAFSTMMSGLAALCFMVGVGLLSMDRVQGWFNKMHVSIVLFLNKRLASRLPD